MRNPGIFAGDFTDETERNSIKRKIAISVKLILWYTNFANKYNATQTVRID